MIRCADLDELLEAAELVAGVGRLGRRLRGGRTGVVTVSTGEASLVADLADRTGLDLPPVGDEARAAILRDLPTMGYIGNPLDPWGAADEAIAYRASFEALAASGAYDVLAIVHDNPFRELPSEVEVATTVSRALVEATAARPELLPVYVSLTSNDASDEVKAFLDANGGMPMLKGAIEAFAAIARLAAWETRRAGAPTRARDGPSGRRSRRIAWRGAPTRCSTRLRRRPRRAGAWRCRSARAWPCLADAGLPVTAWRAVPAEPGAAVAAWRELGGGPVALKLDAPSLAHKSDAGGVALGLADEAAIEAAVTALLTAASRAGVDARGLLVEPMAPAGVELIVGGRRDAVFGPAVLVGAGGILAEVLDDVAVLLAPVTRDEVLTRLQGLRGATLLRGVRGSDAVDLDAVADLVVAVGDLLVAEASIVEIDLNPVIAGPDGAVAVDALVVLDTPPA